MASERSRLATVGYFCGIVGIACLAIGIIGIQIRLFPPMLGFGLFALATIVGGISATLLGDFEVRSRFHPLHSECVRVLSIAPPCSSPSRKVL